MRRGFKMLVAALAIMLLAVGLAACGGGGDSSSNTSGAATQAGGTGSGAPGGSGESNGSDSGTESPGGSTGSESSTPKQHHDSGGGSGQFKVKGGDNSVQEFGAEAESSEFDEAAAALHGFLDARAAGDWAAACSYMSRDVVQSLQALAEKAKQLKGASCPEVFEKLINPAATQELRTEAAQADVGSLRVEGDQAFLIYRGVGDAVLTMPMSHEAGGWKVNGLTGTSLG